MRNSKSPSIYSIYQNALPFYHDRVDLLHIDEKEASFAGDFISQLLAGKVIMQVNCSGLVADKLRHVYFEAKNYERTAGPKSFGLGFPLMIDSWEGELILAPLFIWQLTLEPAQTKVDSWVIKLPDGAYVHPNEQVIKHLKKKYDLDWEERLRMAANSEKLGDGNLGKLLQELIERLQIDEIGESKKLVVSPGIDTIGTLTEKGALHWSGVFGLYPPQFTRRALELIKPEDVFSSSPMELDKEQVNFPFLPCDPEQKSAQNLILENSMSVVEGVDALGKTQTILNLLINSLLNGEKCLVVSERAQALKKVQDLLANSGMDQLHFLLDDALNDYIPMLELMRVMGTGVSVPNAHEEEVFQSKKNKYKEVARQLDKSYHSAKKKIFSDYNWTDMVGLFLNSQQKEGKELLASHLQRSDFKYEKKEYEYLKERVESCRSSFEQVGTLSHPLTLLHHRFFTKNNAAGELDTVEHLLDTQLKEGKKLQRKYLNEIDAYYAKLKSYYLDQQSQLNHQLSELESKLKSYVEELGDAFSEAGSGGLKLGLLFSSKKKKVARAQKEVAKKYQSLLALYGSTQPFEYQPLADKGGMHIARLVSNLATFRDGLNHWKARIEALVQEETNRLNSKTAHIALDVKEEITALEYSLELFLEQLNESELFHKTFENKTLTIPQRQKYLEGILEKLESTRLNLRDFHSFHQWHTNWIGLTDLGKKLLQALIKVSPKNWLAAFESWYFHQLLALAENEHLPKSDDLIYNYANAWHELKPLVINKIIALWKERQGKSLKGFKRKNKPTYQLVFGKPNQQKLKTNSLEQLFEKSFETVTDMFPILFVTPHVAMNVIPEDFEYGLVLFEESNRFSVETAATIAQKGRRVAIFGSDDNNGNETSLLQYALESGVPAAKITNQYDAPTNPLLTVGGGKQLFHFSNEYFIDNLEGRFHEMEGTNDVEAQHIIRLLNQVKQTPQRVYPSVGIVTFTVDQRDLISSYLLKIKQQNTAGSEKIRQLERNGMGVYFTEELFGQQFDILILSCTFGTINLKGELTKKVAFLNTPEGLSHLHLLINKPVQKFYLVHSFSEELLEAFKGKKYDEGTWLLAHFVQLAEATRNENLTLINESLEAIGKKEKRNSYLSPFSTHLKTALSPYIDENRFELALPVDDIVLPLTIDSERDEQPKAALLTDVFLADTTSTSGMWEYRRSLGLKEIGYETYMVSSHQWFKHHREETRKLASKLIKLDTKFNLPKISEEPEDIKSDEITDDQV